MNMDLRLMQLRGIGAGRGEGESRSHSISGMCETDLLNAIPPRGRREGVDNTP